MVEKIMNLNDLGKITIDLNANKHKHNKIYPLNIPNKNPRLLSRVPTELFFTEFANLPVRKERIKRLEINMRQ